MRLRFAFLLLPVILLTGCGGDYKEDLRQADKLYEAGDRESAKKLYVKAANKGSADAHFATAYKYHVTPEERIYHYSKAAMKGHEDALDCALDALLFRANSLERANPQKSA